MNIRMIISRTLAAAAVLSALVWSPAQAASGAEEAARALEAARVLATLRTTYQNTPFTSVRPTPWEGVYEVVMREKVAYTDASGKYFLFGNMIDLQSQVNLTEERSSELNKIDPSILPKELAIKRVKGDGSRVMFVFADPECGYCKMLEKTIDELDNVTVYTYLYAVLGPRSQTNAESVWCAPDRTKAWSDHMHGVGSLQPAKCDNPLDAVRKLGNQLQIVGTPTIVTATGKKVAAAVPLEKLNLLLADQTKAVATNGSPK